MLHFLHRYLPLQRLAIMVLLAAIVYSFFSHAQIDNSPTVAPLYKPIYNIFFAYPTATILSCILLLVAQMTTLLIFNTRNQFCKRRSFMPACCYLLLLLVAGVANAVSPIFFVNPIALLILFILNNNEEAENAKASLYISGFLVAIASMFHTAAACLLVFVCIMAAMKKRRQIKEFITIAVGFITPCFYLFAYCYLRDQMPYFWQFFAPENWICQYLQILDYTVPQYLMAGAMLFIYIYLIILLNLRYQHKTLPCRRHLGQLHLFAFFMLLASGFHFNFLFSAIILAFSCYYTIMSSHKKGWIFHDTLLLLFLMMILTAKLWL